LWSAFFVSIELPVHCLYGHILYIRILSVWFMKKIYCIVLSLLFSLASFSQAFEGEISCVKTTPSDTLFYVYTIKNESVRIDEYDKYKRATRSYIVNSNDKSLLLINQNKRVYTTIDGTVPANLQGMEVICTGNYKYIQGYKCNQWRVRNADANTEISYWLADGNFDFYMPMCAILCSIDDSFLFYNALIGKNLNGVLPLLIENRTLLRSPKSTLSVIEIKQHKVDKAVFSVAGYQKFENLR